MARATSPLPVPVSPVMMMVLSESETFSIRPKTSPIFWLWPMMPLKAQRPFTSPAGAAISDSKASWEEDFLLAVFLDNSIPLAVNLMLLAIGCVGYGAFLQQGSCHIRYSGPDVIKKSAKVNDINFFETK